MRTNPNPVSTQTQTRLCNNLYHVIQIIAQYSGWLCFGGVGLGVGLELWSLGRGLLPWQLKALLRWRVGRSDGRLLLLFQSRTVYPGSFYKNFVGAGGETHLVGVESAYYQIYGGSADSLEVAVDAGGFAHLALGAEEVGYANVHGSAEPELS